MQSLKICQLHFFPTFFAFCCLSFNIAINTVPWISNWGIVILWYFDIVTSTFFDIPQTIWNNIRELPWLLWGYFPLTICLKSETRALTYTWRQVLPKQSFHLRETSPIAAWVNSKVDSLVWPFLRTCSSQGCSCQYRFSWTTSSIFSFSELSSRIRKTVKTFKPFKYNLYLHFFLRYNIAL